MALWIGTSGWSYDHWDGVLYPPGVSTASRLSIYASRFRTVEVNSSFYHWPRDATFAGWRQRLPDGFRMATKAPRGLSHARRLYAPETWVERIERGVTQLGEKQGPVLVQVPPAMECDLPRLDYFLDQLPKGLNVAMELRHPSWKREDVFARLEEHAVAYCVMSGAGLPCVLRATGPDVYVRLHGPDAYSLYAGSYSDDDLRWWAERIQEWGAQRRDVYAYFNNDGGGNAVRNALTLRSLLGDG